MTEAVFRTDAYARECAATVVSADEAGIRLDRTVFYLTGGGQPGDTGELRLADDMTIRIAGTAKGDQGPEDVLHLPQEGATLPAPGTPVTAVIDWERRYSLMRTHTALHLLCAMVPHAVTGGSVGEGRGRLDFDMAENTLDKKRLAEEINAVIAADLPVSVGWITDAELDADPDLVRTMSVQPPRGGGRIRTVRIGAPDGDAVDYQPCGGTHVARTGEIGEIGIGKIEKKGRQNRRINLSLK
ncbi:MAG: alanyl-tRNA editing protein [Acetobacterales bacterium]